MTGKSLLSHLHYRHQPDRFSWHFLLFHSVLSCGAALKGTNSSSSPQSSLRCRKQENSSGNPRRRLCSQLQSGGLGLCLSQHPVPQTRKSSLSSRRCTSPAALRTQGSQQSKTMGPSWGSSWGSSWALMGIFMGLYFISQLSSARFYLCLCFWWLLLLCFQSSSGNLLNTPWWTWSSCSSPGTGLVVSAHTCTPFSQLHKLTGDWLPNHRSFCPPLTLHPPFMFIKGPVTWPWSFSLHLHESGALWWFPTAPVH